jgi:hypothetical protein
MGFEYGVTLFLFDEDKLWASITMTIFFFNIEDIITAVQQSNCGVDFGYVMLAHLF